MERTYDVAVSILCITYNHKEFIEKALNGFLMQKTNFPYEIIIHDDYSTDGTREILLRYKEMYPDKIRLILQEENQYSKGIRIAPTFLFPEIRGKYVAMCEGDDEWIYDRKLQEQYDLLERDKEISLCVHNAIQRNFETCKDVYQVNDLEEGTIPTREVFITTKGRIPTASFFFRAEYVEGYPKFNYDAPVGDDPLRFHCALKGNIYYIDKVWCVRNFMHIGSWNHGMKDKAKKLTYVKSFLKYLKNYSEYTEGKFNASVRELMDVMVGMALNAILPERYSVEILQEGICRLDRETEYQFTEIIWENYKPFARKCYDYVELILKRYVEKCKQVNGKLYIYGAGIEAQKCAEMLNQNQMSFEGFVVSDAYCEKENYLEHKIYSISQLVEVPEKIFFLLGLNKRNSVQVSQLLIKRGYKNFI